MADLTQVCADAAPQELLRGVMQFNRGEYYPCHETLEELWMAEQRPIRELYQGILQLAVALNHLRRGNHRGAVSLLAAGRERLAALPGICRQVDVAALRADSEVLQRRLERLGAARMHSLSEEEIPAIRLHPVPK